MLFLCYMQQSGKKGLLSIKKKSPIKYGKEISELLQAEKEQLHRKPQSIEVTKEPHNAESEVK